MLYPIKFRPILKKRIWGGTRLNKIESVNNDGFAIGESWKISGIEDNISVISNGFLQDNNLEEAIDIYMGDMVGDNVYEKFGNEFPILLKLIDANQNLSIQVHPDDITARDRHHAYGKNEMWYIKEAKPGAQLVVGFNRDISKKEYLEYLNSGNFTDILNYIDIKSGDTIYIPSGTIHAIGKGSLIVEIQQTSDITYRIYDYDRVDENGKKRELHNELALDVIDFTYQKREMIESGKEINREDLLVDSPYFITNYLKFNQNIEKDYHNIDSFVILQSLSGEFSILYDDKYEIVNSGESVLIPAILRNLKLIPKEEAEILEIYLPNDL